MTRTFFLEATGTERLWLRRYVFSDMSKCPGNHGYHNAMNLLQDADIIWETRPDGSKVIACRDERDIKPPSTDPRWPTKCEHCDHLFTHNDPYQLFGRTLYRRQDTGEILTAEEAPAGAMWYADWNDRKGPDGHCLMVKVPGGHDWCVDSRANNCDMPNDKEHRCWVRHGEVPLITVDKNGHTCNAGGGSILTSNWHGFLRNGELVEC